MTQRRECTSSPGADQATPHPNGGGARTATVPAPCPSTPATGAKAIGSARTATATAPSAASAAWAEQLAATLPPLTAAEAVSVGRLAAALDARIEQQNAHTT